MLRYVNTTHVYVVRDRPIDFIVSANCSLF